MDFTYTDEQSMLAEAVGRWLDADYDFARRRRLAAGEESWQSNWSQYADLGLLGLNVPEAHGGMGATSIEALIVMQALGRALAVEPYLQNALVAAPLLARAGTNTQCEAWLAPLASGDKRVVVAAYEPGGGYDLEHVETRATAMGDDFALNGRKSLVIGADGADALLVSARTSGNAGDPAGISLFLVPTASFGVTLEVAPTIDGQRAAEISLRDVTVPAAALVGAVGRGFEELELAIDRGTAGLCAEAVGVMEKLLEMTAEHLRTRKQFGQPIGAFQALQHRAADMAIAIEQARSMALLAAARIDDPDRRERRRAVSAAKTMIGQSGRHVGEQAVHLHGGMGMTDDLAVGWYFKRLVAIDLTHGDADHHLEQFGALL